MKKKVDCSTANDSSKCQLGAATDTLQNTVEANAEKPKTVCQARLEDEHEKREKLVGGQTANMLRYLTTIGVIKWRVGTLYSRASITIRLSEFEHRDGSTSGDLWIINDNEIDYRGENDEVTYDLDSDTYYGLFSTIHDSVVR
jgi:hypothetical protein